MDCYNHQGRFEQQSVDSLDIMKPLPHRPRSRPLLDMRIFSVRIDNFEVDDSTPKHLTLNHIPLGLDTILEVNGGKSSNYSECVSIDLRREIADRTSKVATFVNTDNVRITGSVRFEVYDNDDLLLSGVLELCDGNPVDVQGNDLFKEWNLKCRTHKSTERSLMKGRQDMDAEVLLPTIEVYVAGSFSDNAVLEKMFHLDLVKTPDIQLTLDSNPECDLSKMEKVYPLKALKVTWQQKKNVDLD